MRKRPQFPRLQRFGRLLACLVAAGWIATPPSAFAQFDYEQLPIAYSQTEAQDRIARLVEAVESGERQLRWDEQQGWLPALLEALDVSPESQTLVFSKTSLQIRHISPQNPRALYFSDDSYLGYVPGGDLIELSAVDPQLGPVFYTVEQRRRERPRILRDETQCLTCHSTGKTQGVPGYLVRSVFAGADGQPLYGLGTTTTDHRTPFKERFGGWFVTGQHGEMRHRGNGLAKNDPQQPLDWEAGANQLAVPAAVRADRYPRPGSDLVALMVLEHQSQMHNFITAAQYETRQAIAYQETMNRALERPIDQRSESTTRRIHSAAERLVRCLLFAEEYSLTSPIAGSSLFAGEFEQLGPKDSRGRSLRQFDLQTRLLKYPCSYLIYSPAFDRLPDEVRERVGQRLEQILTATTPERGFEHLTPELRVAIREILLETKPGLLADAATDRVVSKQGDAEK
ncbi:MAG: hypothetical protein ACK53V_16915 [Planctomycetota bacterium]|jgi:hypothetical protein